LTAEALWIATRAGVYGCAPTLVTMVFGLDPLARVGMLVACGLIVWRVAIHALVRKPID
jgi:hypothetical protein